MIERRRNLDRLETALRRSPVAAILGPRQVGKTTLARELRPADKVTFFDLESEPDRRRLENPHFVLGTLRGLVVLDEIQRRPELFDVVRVLVDRPDATSRFLLLGSASPAVLRQASDSLAGRIELVELSGFDLAEVGPESWQRLWVRGGFPRSFLASSEGDSFAWRESFVRTFLERDLPQLGIGIAPAALRRFWTLLAHAQAQVWNAARAGRALGLSDKTVRHYLDLLTGAFVLRQLQPWHENLGKRQVRAPKVTLRDSGLLHALLGLEDRHTLLGHAAAGPSWESFVVEQILASCGDRDAYFWATHGGAEIDLLLHRGGRRFGFEIKLDEAPSTTRSMHTALADLALEHLWIVYPGLHAYPLRERITAWPLRDVPQLPAAIDELLPAGDPSTDSR